MLHRLIFSILGITLQVSVIAQINVQMDIPCRLQWENANGYCGENSVQQISLYYGTYISQNICRNTVCSGNEVLIDVNEHQLINDIGFIFEEFNNNGATPQYQDFFVWMKSQLAQSHPTIIGVYLGNGFSGYDHIIPAIGIVAQNTTTYDPTDVITFNDNFEPTSFHYTCNEFWDNQANILNPAAANSWYWVPNDVCYGIAYTGIKDDNNVCKPVHITVDHWDEPNVTLGQTPIQFNMTVTVEDLTSGENYTLLRYDTYTNIPSTNFNTNGASSFESFTATGTTQVFQHTVNSDGFAAFRCVKSSDLFVGIEENKKETTLLAYPNPSDTDLKFQLANGSISKLDIFDNIGRKIDEITLMNGSASLNVRTYENGNYFYQYAGTDGIVQTGKFAVSHAQKK